MSRQLVDSPSAPAPDRLEEGETLLIGGSWRDAATTYERFDPANSTGPRAPSRRPRRRQGKAARTFFTTTKTVYLRST